MATYYIATTGNDTTGNGSSGLPWATLAKAITSSAVDDTIMISAGTYTWANATMPRRTFIGPSYMNAGLFLPTAIFDGAGASVNWIFSGNFTMQNIMCQNSITTSSSKTLWDVSTASVTLTTYNCVLRNCKSAYDSNGGNGGLLRAQGSGALQVHNSLLLYGCRSNQAYNSGNPCALRCNAGKLRFYYCTLYFNDSTTDKYEDLGDSIGGGESLWKNTIVQWDQPNSPRFDMRYTSPVVETGSSNVNFKGMQQIPTIPNRIGVDSLFVDTVNGNFNLQSGSPARNAGTIQ